MKMETIKRANSMYQTVGMVALAILVFIVSLVGMENYFGSQSAQAKAGVCTFAEPEEEAGVVLQHKQSPPYPFPLCGVMLNSKLVIEDPFEEGRYFGYITPDTKCTRAGAWIPCSDIKRDEVVSYTMQKRGNATSRGKILQINVDVGGVRVAYIPKHGCGDLVCKGAENYLTCPTDCPAPRPDPDGE